VMTNLAQTINVLQCVIHTDGPKMWLTPTYHVFDMYKSHASAESLRLEIDCATVEARGADGKVVELPVLTASASKSAGQLTLTVTNRSLTEEVGCRVEVDGSGKLGEGSVTTLTADNVRDYNEPRAKNRVAPKSANLRRKGSQTELVLGPHSVTEVCAKIVRSA